MSGRSTLRVALVALLLLVIQSTVILPIRLGGVHPDIVWLLPITASLLAGPETGAVIGFWSGLAFDLVLPTPFGLTALVGCLLGYSIGTATAAVDQSFNHPTDQVRPTGRRKPALVRGHRPGPARDSRRRGDARGRRHRRLAVVDAGRTGRDGRGRLAVAPCRPDQERR